MIAYNAQTSYGQYKENSALTAKPEELTLMLYNGLVKFIMRAKDAVENGRMEEAHNNIIRAQDIITEFNATLDMQYDIAISLELIYDYMARRLVDANIKKSIPILDEVLGFSKDLRDTWEQAMKVAKKPGRKEEPTVPVSTAQ